jgi:hypothetical protein
VITLPTTTKTPNLSFGQNPPIKSWPVSNAFVCEFLIQDTTLLACSGVALLAGALIPRVSPSIPWPEGEGRRIMLCLSAALVAYVAALSTLGFTISTALFLWAAISFWRSCSVLISAILALVMTSGLYVLFVTILHMSLPHGVLIPF